MSKVIEKLAESIQARQASVLATVIESEGGSPAKAGAKILLHGDLSVSGTVGGGILEEVILEDCKAALQDGRPRHKHYALRQEGEDAIGMICGGDVQVFIEPYLPNPVLVIVGGGHIGRPLKTLAETVGFEVDVVDVEPGRATVEGLESLELTSKSHVVIITADHRSDEAALRVALETQASYIGMIGSQSKCAIVLDHLQSDGFSQETLDRVHTPIGLDLGGVTPSEIALAILAEVVAERHGKAGGMLSQARRKLTELA
jgi:xanthine dehydrogenase accessory factor